MKQPTLKHNAYWRRQARFVALAWGIGTVVTVMVCAAIMVVGLK